MIIETNIQNKLTFKLGEAVGLKDGKLEGATVGLADGCKVAPVGLKLGVEVGLNVG